MKKLFIVALILAAVTGLNAQTVIKIASQSPLSGAQAEQGEYIKNGAQLAVEEAVPALKKLGLDLQFVPYDDQATPDTGVANANRIINDKDILGVVGHLNSGVMIPSSEVYNQTGLVVVSPANTNPKVTDRGLPDVNRVCGRDDIQGPAGADFAIKELKAKKIFVINSKTAYGAGIAAEFVKRAEALGVKIPGNANVGTEEKSNFITLITQIQAYGPDLIYFGGELDQVPLFTKQLRERGSKVPLLGGDAIVGNDYIKTVGAKSTTLTYYTDVAGPASLYPDFIKKYSAKFGTSPGGYAVYAYDSANVVITAILNSIKAAGGSKPSLEAVAKAVRTINYNGLTGNITFDSKGDRSSALYFIMQYGGTEDVSGNKLFKKLTVAAPKAVM